MELVKKNGEPSVPATTSKISTGIANLGLQSLISRKPVPCTISINPTIMVVQFFVFL